MGHMRCVASDNVDGQIGLWVAVQSLAETVTLTSASLDSMSSLMAAAAPRLVPKLRQLPAASSAARTVFSSELALVSWHAFRTVASAFLAAATCSCDRPYSAQWSVRDTTNAGAARSQQQIVDNGALAIALEAAHIGMHVGVQACTCSET